MPELENQDTMETDMEQKIEIQILETLEQKRETIPLYQQAFQDPQLFVDYYYKEKCKDNWIFVKKKDNQVIAMLHLNPYTIVVNGKEFPTFYIVAVATQKQYRHQGHMRDLLCEAFEWMRQREIPFCFLMPVNPSIYEPFGFEKICEFDRNPNRTPEEISEQFNIYCKRDKKYQSRLQQERELAAKLGAEEDGLPENPIIMARIINRSVFARLSNLKETEDESDQLKWLRKQRIYICEEV